MTMKRSFVTAAAAVVAALACAAPAAQAADPCPNAIYRNGAGANLPDCRAWEQVTRQNKNGERSDGRAGYATPDGNKLVFPSLTALSDADGDSREPGGLFSSVRGSGWSTLNMEPFQSPPGTFFGGSASRNISDDRSKAVAVSDYKLTSDGVEGASNIYARSTTDGSYTLLGTLPGRDFYRSYYLNDVALILGNADLSRVALTASQPLTPDAPSGQGLYLLGGGNTTLVGRGVDNAPLSGADTASRRPVSSDGRRVTFSAALSDSDSNRVLYQRLDAASTVLISRSHRPGANQLAPVATRDTPAVSADGTDVVFTAYFGSQPLTDDGPGPFYRWSANGDKLTSVLAGVSAPWSANALEDSFSLLRVSEGGRYVWLTLTDQDGAGNAFNELAVIDTATKQASIKARFPGTTPSDSFNPLRFSPDGTKLVGATSTNLTAYEQSGPACAAEGGRCSEAFFLDAEQPGADPVCISCGGPGTRSVGGLDLNGFGGGSLPPAELVADTGEAIFATNQRLATGDLNTLADVYVYTPGRGPSLITTGSGNASASPVAINASGSDAFFRTADPLVPQDNDADSDTYDARVGGGLAAQQIAPVSGSPCPLGRCPGAHTSVPLAGSPATAAFQAANRPPVFTAAGVSRAARRSAARTGRLKVAVTVGAAGKLSARASARIGRRSVTVARSSRTARRAGRFTLTLGLSRAARATLAQNRALDVNVTVSYSRAATTKRQTVQLAVPRSRGAAKGGAR